MIVQKIKKKIWKIIVERFKDKSFYPYLYKSYWYSLMPNGKAIASSSDLYFTAQPNIGAGIGHQMANWIAGYWFAKKFDVNYSHTPFSNEEWEYFFGFGEKEISTKELIDLRYKKRRIPLFKEGNNKEVERTQRIINSYRNKKVILVCEQDQFYKDQYGIIDELKYKFYNSSARENQKLVYEKGYTNIVIHVRRGDILLDPSNPNLQMRYISTDYFELVLDQVLSKVKDKDLYKIYFFSQGTPQDFKEFEKYENLVWCLDMNAKDSFLHMVYADILITSKSSFSYKPALLNKGIKICPENFWHGYPKSKDWLLVSDKGNIKMNKGYQFSSYNK